MKPRHDRDARAPGPSRGDFPGAAAAVGVGVGARFARAETNGKPIRMGVGGDFGRSSAVGAEVGDSVACRRSRDGRPRVQDRTRGHA
jgi:hypothetical protein